MTATRRKSSAGEQAPPAEQAPVESGQPEQPAAAPTPAVDEAGPVAAPTQAAPLDPPARPEPPAPDPGPTPQIRMLATPGSEFVDLVWGDNPAGQPKEKADPDELFHDPGAQFSYVIVARPIVRLFHMPGANGILGEQLFRNAGVHIDRGHANHIRQDLAAVRAAEQAD
ncbi:hypothetical protein [Nonomuraea recticatena]|uniref:Uncharacterized protein n=1 Tax=Nonomuraea recticatena TaxID=46178 RepID=A0ABN3T239_9ACTN